jgi:hypothetical protein
MYSVSDQWACFARPMFQGITDTIISTKLRDKPMMIRGFRTYGLEQNSMIRITRKVFSDLTIWMIGFGLLMGVAFPFFTYALGVGAEKALTIWFFAACMAAGFIVGAVNIALARRVVGNRLRLLADRMRLVKTNLMELAETGNMEKYSPESCLIDIDSEDEIVKVAKPSITWWKPWHLHTKTTQPCAPSPRRYQAIWRSIY